MANLFLPVVAPAANGSGAAVDFSSYGAEKTIIVGGTWDLLPTINIEINNAALSTDGGWQSIATFVGSGIVTLVSACKWIRATVSNYRGGQAPIVNIGGTDDGTTLANLPAPASNGTGATIDTSALGVFKTVQVSDAFGGTVIIEVSEDGGTTWGEQFAFSAGGAKSAIVSADRMRVRRTGVPGVSPGLPEVNVGGTTSDGGGGGGGNRQTFAYTVTGLEPDLMNLVIPLPVARASSNYQVQVTQSDSANFLGPKVNGASRAVGQFVLSLTSEATAADVFWFTVEDLT